MRPCVPQLNKVSSKANLQNINFRFSSVWITSAMLSVVADEDDDTTCDPDGGDLIMLKSGRKHVTDSHPLVVDSTLAAGGPGLV